MKKRDRVFAAIRGEEVDHVPCGFSLHFPHDCAFGDASVEAHLRFFKETDTDIIKIMNENLVPDVGEIRTAEDWKNKKDDLLIDYQDFNCCAIPTEKQIY